MDGSPSRGNENCEPYADLRLLARSSIFAGCPCKVALVDLDRAGETIPIRLFLGGFDLTPTFREVNKKYSTRYYLSLVLIDEGEFF